MSCFITPTDLEVVLLEHAVLDVLLDLLHDRQHGHVRLTGAGGRADEHVVVRLVRRLVHL